MFNNEFGGGRMYAQATYEFGPFMTGGRCGKSARGFAGAYTRDDEHEGRGDKREGRGERGGRHGRHEHRGGHEHFDPRELWLAMSGRAEGRGGRGRGPGYGHFGRGGGGFPFGGFGPGGPRGRGRKARRGDMRTAALLLLAEGSKNGYEMMREVEERSGGVWRPSPGSVYPALQQLEDEGLIRSTESDGRKLYELTDSGESLLAERGDGKPAPWDEMSNDFGEKAFELGNMMKEVGFAFMQVMRTGSDSQIDEARKVLSTARKELYKILADGDEGDSAQDEANES